MADIRHFFGKQKAGNSALPKDTKKKLPPVRKEACSPVIEIPNSDEEPIPLPIQPRKGPTRRSRRILDDDEIVPQVKTTHRKKDIHPEGFAESHDEDDLYQSIKKVDTHPLMPKHQQVDAAVFFQSKPVEAPMLLTLTTTASSKDESRKASRKRKSLPPEMCDFLVEDKDAILAIPGKKVKRSLREDQKNEDHHHPLEEEDIGMDDGSFNSRTSKKEDLNTSGVSLGEKKRGFTAEGKARFLQSLQREPPKLLGTKPLPVGSKNCLEGLTFVITGILECIEREDTESLIQRYGGRVTKSVSRKTSYLVVGREPGETKLNKAKDVETHILQEEEFYKLISNTENNEQQPSVTAISSSGSSFLSIEEAKHQPSQATAKTSYQVPKTLVAHKGTSKFSLGLIEDQASAELWVEKYKPTLVADIVGQSGAKSPAHKLLRWLEEWYHNRRSSSKKNFFEAKESGSIFKAALMSGSPGIGKSTTAHLCCKQLGFDTVELNASDIRSKNSLDAFLSVSLANCKITYESITKKSALIMDEVDGMSGNEDRGGMQELISLIKGSQMPIICICNDRNHQKIRSLANYCFDIRFPKPRVDNIKEFAMKVAQCEYLHIEPQAMEQIVITSHNDIRQILNNLQMWSSSKKYFAYDDVKAEASSSAKDIRENVFDVVRKIFTYSMFRKMSTTEKSDCFFLDYSLIPLFVFENYLHTLVPEVSKNPIKYLSNLAKAAESISNGAVCETEIRSRNAWSLLSTQAIFSCVIPCDYTCGIMGGQITFPQWLGKNSSANKGHRIIQTLTQHTRLRCNTSKTALNLDYLPHFYFFMYEPLIVKETEGGGVDEVISRLDDYDLTREDWESIVEFSQWTSRKLPPIVTKVKSAFTRNENKRHRALPFPLLSGASMSGGAKGNFFGGEVYPEEGQASGDDEPSDTDNRKESNSIVKDSMIKAVTTPVVQKTAKVRRGAKTK